MSVRHCSPNCQCSSHCGALILLPMHLFQMSICRSCSKYENVDSVCRSCRDDIASGKHKTLDCPKCSERVLYNPVRRALLFHSHHHSRFAVWIMLSMQQSVGLELQLCVAFAFSAEAVCSGCWFERKRERGRATQEAQEGRVRLVGRS